MFDWFFVVRVKYLKDGTMKKSELMDYTTENRAVAKYHSNMGTDMVDETLAGGYCTVLNGHGGEVISGFWKADEDTPADGE